LTGELGLGRIKLINLIIAKHWTRTPETMRFRYNEVLFLIQELLKDEGREYFSEHMGLRGFGIFREFVKMLLYRNLANYDSMVLLTSDKGCITDDCLIEMPRDLNKYPKGVPIKDLIDKKDFYVYSFNTQIKQIELKKAGGCCFVKEDDVYELELTNGMKIKTTKDHPFFLTDGIKKELKDLFYNKEYFKRGDSFNRYRNGSDWVYTDRLRIISSYRGGKDNFFKYNYSEIDYENKDSIFKHAKIEHRFIMEQLNYDIINKVIHHKDDNHNNNNIENLEILNGQSEHHYKHNMEEYHFKNGNNFGSLNIGTTFKKGLPKIHNRTIEFSNMCREQKISYFILNGNKKYSDAAIERCSNNDNINSNHIRHGGVIKSITYLGKQKVYDIYDVQDNHNFIANGFVVGNTGKSSCAMMMAREWCRLIGIQFSPKRHIAYSNADVMNKIDTLNPFEPLIADESVRFASAAEWAKRENRELKKRLAQVRTKHLFFILCFPLKVYKLDKVYLESFVNYWCTTKDTSILISDKRGLRKLPIEVLARSKPNYQVATYNIETDKIELKKPIDCVMTKREAEVYEVELVNGQKIKATAEHQFLTNNGYKKLIDLTESDEIVMRTKECLECKKEFIPKKEQMKYCSKKCCQDYNCPREERIKYLKNYRKNNPEKVKKQGDENYRKHKKQRLISAAIYREKNREYVNNYAKIYRSIKKDYWSRYLKNPSFKIGYILSSRLRNALKSQNSRKKNSIKKYIGCSIDELKQYIEKQFKHGMSWENHGKWHIDHIRPCSSFNLINEEECEKCFHFSNLQPLWEHDNKVKSDNYDSNKNKIN
jgi:intein/homing endonuclease